MFSSFTYGGNAELIKTLALGESALKVNELGEWIRQVTATTDESKAIIRFVQERISYLFSVISRNDIELHTLNAGELIFHYIQFFHEKKGVEDVLAGALNLLVPSRYPISQTAAIILKRTCELCMAKNIAWTNSAVAQCMTDELIDGVVMHIGSSSTVSEAILELLGAHIKFAIFFQQDLVVSSFSASWIKFEFPEKVVELALQALVSPEKYLALLFLKGMCTMNLNPAVEPLVDAFLKKKLLDSLLAGACSSSKLFLSHPNGNGCLVPDVLDIFASALRLVRQSFPLFDPAFHYSGNILEYSPVGCVCESLSDLVDLLKFPSSPTGTPVVCSKVRSSVCAIVKELVLFQMKNIDERVRDSGYFDLLVGLCERFPNNNATAQVLGESFTAVFDRLNCENDQSKHTSNILVDYFRDARGLKLIAQICRFVIEDSYGVSAIRSHCFRFLQTLQAREWFIVQLPPQIREDIETGVGAMKILLEKELTGKDFEERGSACVPPPPNEEVSNFAGVKDLSYPPRSSPDIQEEKKEEYISPSLKPLENESQDNFLMGDLTSDQVHAYPSFCNVMLAFEEKTDDQ